MGFLGSYRECIALMRRMVNDFPNDVDVLNKYGVLMLTIGKNDRATPVYENVLRIDPDNAFAKVHLGFVLKIGGDLTTAIELLRAGLIHTNDEPNVFSRENFTFISVTLYLGAGANKRQENGTNAAPTVASSSPSTSVLCTTLTA